MPNDADWLEVRGEHLGIHRAPEESLSEFEQRLSLAESSERTRVPDPRLTRISDLMERLGDLQALPQAERRTQEDIVRLARAMPATPEEQQRYEERMRNAHLQIIEELGDAINWNFLKSQLKRIIIPATEAWLERWRK